MATDQMLQWQSHITDSTDRDTIIGNLNFLEDFAGAIMGDESLHNNFAEIRNGINNGTLKPTDWKTSQDFQNIITKLKEASSVKLTQYGKALEDHGTKLDQQAKDIEDHGTKLDQQAQDIEDHGTKLDQQAQDIKDQGSTLTQYGKTISSHTTTLTDHGSSIKTISDWKNKIDKIGKLASMTEVENLRTLINNEVSHWTREAHPKPIDTYKTLADLKTIAQPWEAGDDPERHINDLCTVIGETQPDKGVSYRFIRHPDNNTYKWVKVVDNDGVLALDKFTKFKQVYDQRQNALDSDSKAKQKSIDDMAQKVKDQSTEIEDQRKKLDASYKVTVTTQGYIRNGEIIDGTTSGGVPVIRHQAYVYDIVGNKVTDTAITSKLTWTINKGRTTKPIARTVTGDICDVSTKDFVKGGSTPNYYDIELSSLF